MKKRIFIFFAAFIVWILLNWAPDWQHYLVGIIVATFVAYMTGDLFYRNEIFFDIRRVGYFVFQYLPLFLWSYLCASFNVAYRVLHPSLLIKPGIVKVKTCLRSEAALAFLANTITLTSGTLTVDIDQDNGILYVHWIDVKTEDIDSATKMIVGRFEPILKKIFE